MTAQQPDLLDPSVLEAARRAADEEGVPLEQFVSAIVTEALKTRDFFNERVKGADRASFQAVWHKSAGVPPVPGDELPEGVPGRHAAE